MTDIVLWLDTETAGPDLPNAKVDTVLEVAWTITQRYPADNLRFGGVDRWQLTPLRSRFTTLTPLGPSGFADHLKPRAGGPQGRIEWPEKTGRKQRDMHAESGLDVAHANTLRDLILDDGRELDRLIVDDVHRAIAAVGGSFGAVEETDRVTLYLGGDGIGHYDRALIDRECPRVARHLHYRPVDISVAVQTLSAAEQSPMRVLATMNDGIRRDFAATLRSLDVDESARTVDGGIEWWLDPECVDPHRAAPDVVRSMLAYTTGRYRVRHALSVEQSF